MECVTLVGFKLNFGTFKNDNDELIDYDNRYLCCLIKDEDHKDSFGSSAFSFKLKKSDLAKSLNVHENAVDEMLTRLINKQIEIVYSVDVKKNELKISGIRQISKI